MKSSCTLRCYKTIKQKLLPNLAAAFQHVKSLTEFAALAAKKIKSFSTGGVYLGENTCQAAKRCLKALKGISGSLKKAAAGIGSSFCCVLGYRAYAGTAEGGRQDSARSAVSGQARSRSFFFSRNAAPAADAAMANASRYTGASSPVLGPFPGLPG